MRLKKNIRTLGRKNSLSESSEKKSDLLIQVNELMENLESNYGPLMLEELQKRFKKTIEDFQEDVSAVLKDAFDDHDLKYKNLSKKIIKNSGDEDVVPSFISEYQNKKKKK